MELDAPDEDEERLETTDETTDEDSEESESDPDEPPTSTGAIEDDFVPGDFSPPHVGISAGSSTSWTGAGAFAAEVHSPISSTGPRLSSESDES